MGRSHKTCELCWEGDVLTEGFDRCARCKDEWLRIRKAYDELCTRYPAVRRFSVASIFERFVKRAIAARPK